MRVIIIAFVLLLVLLLSKYAYWEVTITSGAPVHVEILDKNNEILFEQDVYNNSAHYDVRSDFIRVNVYCIGPDITVAKMLIYKNKMGVFNMERVLMSNTIPWQVDASTI